MTYQGHVENGAVVLDDPVALPNGAKVKIMLVEMQDVVEPSPAGARERLGKFAGAFTGLPDDASVNIDHYLQSQASRSSRPLPAVTSLARRREEVSPRR